MSESKPPFPPFTEETARAKVKAAENAWNTRNPDVVALAYTEDSDWRNRTDFFKGREAIREFLRKKWSLELDYRLMKELWAFTGNKIAVQFEYEWRNEAHQWYETIGVLIYMLQPAVEMGLIFCELKNRKLNYGRTLTLCKFRTHGNELWEFEANGLMRRRDMSANDVPILESERRHFPPADA